MGAVCFCSLPSPSHHASFPLLSGHCGQHRSCHTCSTLCQHQQRDQPHPGTHRTATQWRIDISGFPPRRLLQPTAVSQVSGEHSPKQHYETSRALCIFQTAPWLQVPLEPWPGLAAPLRFLKWLHQLSMCLPPGKLRVMRKAGENNR